MPDLFSRGRSACHSELQYLLCLSGRACSNPDVLPPSWPHARSQWWVGYLLGANANYLSKGPGFLDPRWGGPRPPPPRPLISLWTTA